MKGLIFGENISQLLDGLGFLQTIGKAVGEGIEAYGFLVGEKEEVKGFKKIYVGNKATTEAISEKIIEVIQGDDFDIVVGPATKNGTDVIGRVAAKLDYPFIAEATEIGEMDGNVVVKRQVIGGRGLASYYFKKPLAVTVPQKKFMPSPEGESVFEEIEIKETEMKIVETLPKERGEADIEAAEIVVGVGRGFKSKDDLQMAFELAKLLGGEVGCSRPVAADMHWLGEDRWIGISGKKVRGKLYIAIGISGAPQHIMAASDVKVVVAINKDKNAPIFTYADYGVVADLYQFLPVLIQKLKEKKSS